MSGRKLPFLLIMYNHSMFRRGNQDPAYLGTKLCFIALEELESASLPTLCGAVFRSSLILSSSILSLEFCFSEACSLILEASLVLLKPCIFSSSWAIFFRSMSMCSSLPGHNFRLGD